MDLALTRQIAQSAYLKGRNTGISEKRLDLLRRLIDECGDMAAQIQQPAPAAAPAPAAPPLDPAAMPPIDAATAGLPVPAVPSELPA